MKFVRYLVLSVVVVALGLLGSLVKPANEGALARGRVWCMVIVQPGESIQAAIDRAQEGAVVCLAVGTWRENLYISKSLTLLGAGRGKTIIEAPYWGYGGLLDISSASAIEVEIEGLTVTHGSGSREGIQIGGQAKATITDCEVSDNSYGIKIRDSAQATITDCEVSGNGTGIYLGGSSQAEIKDSAISKNDGEGIWMEGAARATITDCEFSGNGEGIYLRDSSQAEIKGSQVSGNKGNGIHMEDDAQAKITDCEVSGNEDAGIVVWEWARLTITGSKVSDNRGAWYTAGIMIADGAQATITSCQVSGNENFGINVMGSAQVEIVGSQVSGNSPGIGIDYTWLKRGDYNEAWARVRISGCSVSFNVCRGIVVGGHANVTITGSTIEGNGTKWEGPYGWECNGITVYDESHTTIIDSKIINNHAYGVSAGERTKSESSGYGLEDFKGRVEFQGTNVIEGNGAGPVCLP